MPVHLATDGTHSTSESGLSQLYDSPWNVYKCFGTLPTIQRDSLVARLKQFEDDAVRPIPGELLECTADLISIQAGTNTLSGVALRCLFDHKHLGTEFRLIHLNNPAKEVSLLLLKSGVPRQMLVDLFNEMLGLPPFEELKLPSSLLSSQLESYLETLVAYGPTHDPDSYIHSIVGKLDIKVTFEAPVSPNLRSLDINVPATEVWSWLSASPHQQGTFLTRLTGYLQTNTGLRLGLGSLRGPDEAPQKAADATRTQTLQNQNQPMTPAERDPELGADKERGQDAIDSRENPGSISKVSCGAFILNTTGVFTLKKGPVNAAHVLTSRSLVDALEMLNGQLLAALFNAANDGG